MMTCIKGSLQCGQQIAVVWVLLSKFPFSQLLQLNLSKIISSISRGSKKDQMKDRLYVGVGASTKLKLLPIVGPGYLQAHQVYILPFLG